MSNRVTVKVVGPDIELIMSKATRIRRDSDKRQFIHFDQLKDGTWRLTWSSGVVEEWSTVEALVMSRGDD